MSSVKTFLLLAFVGVVLATAETESSDESPCANSSDRTECERRSAICRSMMQRTHTPARMLQSIRTCAEQLNIALPTPAPAQQNSASENESRYYTQLRMWMRSNPVIKRQIFSCAHQSMFNADGTPRRDYLKTRVFSWVGEEETKLRQLLEINIDQCAAPSRRQYLNCVFQACNTP